MLRVERGYNEEKNNKNKKVATLIAYIGDSLAPNETREINTSVGFDLKNATSKKILEY